MRTTTHTTRGRVRSAAAIIIVLALLGLAGATDRADTAASPVPQESHR